jgi:hypothetical protein
MMNGEKSIPNGLIIRPEKHHNSWTHPFLDVYSWLGISKGSEQRDREFSKTDKAMEDVLSQ